METPSEIRDFSGICRLFPLPGVVLFPHVILPLHIFEPRYRQMTQDALESDQFLTIVQSRPLDAGMPWVEPVPIEDVGCVGRIIQHERLLDGRFNLLLLGCKRVSLIGDVASPKLYRLAEGALLEDEGPGDTRDQSRAELVRLFEEVLKRRHRLDPDLCRLLQSDLSLGILGDIIAHALDLPASVKQTLLAEPRVPSRISSLISQLQRLVEELPLSRRFPRPFSLN
jgi:Lon protease-like protein